MDEARRPAAVFPVGSFVFEEMETRGWDNEDMAAAMGGDRAENLFCLEALDVQPPGLLLGADMAARIGHAFGTSAELWLNLDKAWQKTERN